MQLEINLKKKQKVPKHSDRISWYILFQLFIQNTAVICWVYLVHVGSWLKTEKPLQCVILVTAWFLKNEWNNLFMYARQSLAKGSEALLRDTGEKMGFVTVPEDSWKAAQLPR